MIEKMRFIDLTGKRFGKLVVQEHAGVSKFKAALWKCRCDCGKEVIVNSNALRTGHTQSCGCKRKEATSQWLKKYNTKHSACGSRLYVVWEGIKQRVSNPNNSHYKYYGGRGITICEEWKDDFAAFETWAFQNGYDPTAEYGECTIDRIDVDGNYEPSNCRWVSLKDQASNKRRKQA